MENTENIKIITELIRPSGILSAIFVIAFSWLALKFIEDTTDKLSQQFPARRLLLQQISTIVKFFIYILTATVAIGLSIQLDEKSIALIGGTLAVSIGFAVKDLVSSFVAGLMIMIDRPFQVGDRVMFGGEYGDITAIGLRSVRMQTLEDNTVTIPNNKFLSDMTSSGNYGALDMQVQMDFYIGATQDVDQAREIVNEAALTSRYVFLPKPVVVLVTQQLIDNQLAIRLRLKAYVLDTQYEKLFETDVNLRVLRAFNERHIIAPCILHRTIDTSKAS